MWAKRGRTFSNIQNAEVINTLEPGVYKPVITMMGIYFDKMSDSFELPSKIYGNDQEFVDRVVNVFQSGNKNLGALLTGLKGTGKSVDARRIANQTNLPVIMIDNAMEGNIFKALDDLDDIECVFFMDEFEKIFDSNDQKRILTYLDGGGTGKKKMFLLTSNSLSVNEFLISRPSRIRYIKRYSDLTPDVFTEIIEDMLVNKDLLKDAIKEVSNFSIITMDLIKEFISEVNFTNNVETAAKHFNIADKQYKVCIRITDTKSGEYMDQVIYDQDMDDVNSFRNRVLENDSVHIRGYWLNPGDVIDNTEDHISFKVEAFNNGISQQLVGDRNADVELEGIITFSPQANTTVTNAFSI